MRLPANNMAEVIIDTTMGFFMFSPLSCASHGSASHKKDPSLMAALLLLKVYFRWYQ
ncbi:MAG: hypothetical protein ABSH25_09575 [Syntrophorhabdales bacterium]